jgi:hypothetical protein
MILPFEPECGNCRTASVDCSKSLLLDAGDAIQGFIDPTRRDPRQLRLAAKHPLREDAERALTDMSLGTKSLDYQPFWDLTSLAPVSAGAFWARAPKPA